MKARLIVFLSLAILSAQAETFEDITRSFKLGDNKKKVLDKEPTGFAMPFNAKPIDPSRSTEVIAVVRRTPETGLSIQFFFVDDKLAAIFLGKLFRPGVAFNPTVDTGYLTNAAKLNSFTALRIDRELNPIDAGVTQYSYGQTNHAALVVSSPMGSEAWIVDTTVFDPKSFFIEATAAEREKALLNKKRIEANMKRHLDFKKNAQTNGAANPSTPGSKPSR